jgi:transposase-like protein
MMYHGINTPRRRRRYSAEFKDQLIQACKQPGVSNAAMALRYQLNANQVRIWIRAYEQLTIQAAQATPVTSVPEFIPSHLSAPTAATVTPDIVIEIRRGAANVTVRWPQAAAAECASLLAGHIKYL